MTNMTDIRMNRTFGRMSWRTPSMNNSDRTTKGTSNDRPYREDIQDRGDVGELTVRTDQGTPDEVARHIQDYVAKICQRAQMLMALGIETEIIEAGLNENFGNWGVWSIIETEDRITIQCHGHDPDE